MGRLLYFKCIHPKMRHHTWFCLMTWWYGEQLKGPGLGCRPEQSSKCRLLDGAAWPASDSSNTKTGLCKQSALPYWWEVVVAPFADKRGFLPRATLEGGSSGPKPAQPHEIAFNELKAVDIQPVAAWLEKRTNQGNRANAPGTESKRNWPTNLNSTVR